MEAENVVLETLSEEEDLQQPSTSTAANIQSKEKKSTLQNAYLFGEPCKFKGDMLPTTGDVLRYIFLLYQDELKVNKSASLKSYVPLVSQEIIDVWEKTEVPTISLNGVRLKVSRAIDEYKISSKQSATTAFPAYIMNLGSIFDIASCKCDILHGECQCEDEKKIPSADKEFIVDQRTDRNMRIIEEQEEEEMEEVEEVQPGQETQEDQEDQEDQASSEVAQSGAVSQMVTDSDESESTPPIPVQHTSSSDFVPSSSDLDATPVSGPSMSSSRYIRAINIPRFALECDRYGISDRIASALATSLSQDFELKDYKGEDVIIDRNKIRHEREKSRQKIMRERADVSLVKAFSFDSRSDTTLAPVMIEGRQHPRNVKETHYVVLRQPNSVYLGHFASEHGTSSRKATTIMNFFNDKNIGLTQLFGICSDGEPVNAGRKDGILRNFELRLNKPLHWFICLLHFNELPLRHLFAKIDGATTGPTTSTGVIANQLENIEMKDVRQQRKI